jgi:hypothetical protein
MRQFHILSSKTPEAHTVGSILCLMATLPKISASLQKIIAVSCNVLKGSEVCPYLNISPFVTYGTCTSKQNTHPLKHLPLLWKILGYGRIIS